MHTIYDLTTRKFKSEYHRREWAKYDTVLMYRSIISLFCRVIMQIGWSALSLNVWHETRRGLDAGKFANSELVEQIFPYAKNAMIALNIGRGLLFLISLKWHHVTKLNYYYEMVSFLVECLLPYDISNNIS